MICWRRIAGTAAALCLVPIAALAHTVYDSSGFVSGLLHPVLGADDIVVIIAVGLWAAFLGSRAIVALPVSFLCMMAVGGGLGIAGLYMPFTEAMVLVSAAVLGALLAFGVRMPAPFAAALVGAFALFHGIAHGTELPLATHPAGFVVGFLVATAVLLLWGCVFGLLSRWREGRILVRATGVALSVAGLALMIA